MEYSYTRDHVDGVELEFLAVGTDWEPYRRATYHSPAEGGYFNDIEITLVGVDGREPTDAEVALYLKEEIKHNYKTVAQEMSNEHSSDEEDMRAYYAEKQWEYRNDR